MPPIIEPLGEHELLFLFVQLFLLLVTARGLGEVARRVGFPSVLGELLAGIVLGPSLLGAVAPGVFTTIFPQTPSQYHLVEVVSWIGLVMLLVVTGLETDLDLIARRAKPATYTAVTGIAIPFATGFALAWVLPTEFLAADGRRLVFALFIATALSISAIPVIAKVLLDMDVMERDIGQITIASGMLNDTIGWVLLAVVASLARSGGGEALTTAGTTILTLVIFLGIAFTFGRRWTERFFRWVDHAVGDDELSKTTAVMVLALGVGSITHYLGLEAVLGAFVVGVLVGQVRRFDRAARHVFEVVTLGIFAPIFFATAGLRVDLTLLLDPLIFLGSVAVLAVAIFGKFVGSFVGARAAGLSNWEGIAMGAGLNARGALEIIVATIGVSVGVLTRPTYTIIVVVAIVTSLLAPPLLRWSLARVERSAEETERIEREAMEEASFLGNVVRVLLPTRGSVHSQFAAQLLGHVARVREMDVTVMYVNPDEEPDERGRPLKQGLDLTRRVTRALFDRTLATRPESDGGAVERERETPTARECLELIDTQLDLPDLHVRGIDRRVETSVSETVLEEAAEGYDLLVLGVGKRTRDAGGPLFDTHIDDIIEQAPCPLLTVRSDFPPSDGPLGPVAIRDVLLPTVGTEYSRDAAEVAFAIAADRDATVEIMHVVDRPYEDEFDEVFIEPRDFSEAVQLGKDITRREADLGRTMGADVYTNVEVGEKPDHDIVSRAIIDDVDLIVLGSEIRSTSQRPFFGHTVEYVLENAPCPVVVVST